MLIDAYPNNKAILTIESSNYPLPIKMEDDLNDFYIFLGQVRQKVLPMLGEVDQFLQPTSQWILEQCDVNQDVPITAKAQLTMPKELQVSIAGRVFRQYIKDMEGKPVYRVEESLAPGQPVIEAIKAINALKQQGVIAQ